MRCERCDHENVDDARFCAQCGHALGGRSERSEIAGLLAGRDIDRSASDEPTTELTGAPPASDRPPSEVTGAPSDAAASPVEAVSPERTEPTIQLPTRDSESSADAAPTSELAETRSDAITSEVTGVASASTEPTTAMGAVPPPSSPSPSPPASPPPFRPDVTPPGGSPPTTVDPDHGPIEAPPRSGGLAVAVVFVLLALAAAGLVFLATQIGDESVPDGSVPIDSVGPAREQVGRSVLL